MPEVGQWGPQPLLSRIGRPITAATLTVYEDDGTTPASLYADQGGVTALANPLPTGVATTAAGLDVRGNVSLYAVPGAYVLAVEVAGDEVYRSPITVAIDSAAAGTGTVTGVNGQSPDPGGEVTLTAADVGADSAGAAAAAAAASIPLAQKGAPSGVASLDGGGLVLAAQIPPVAISAFLGDVASQAAMLALSGQRGDWAVRTDLSTTWLLITDDPTQLANWKQLVTPTDIVLSVEGRTGVVSLSDLFDAAGDAAQALTDAEAYTDTAVAAIPEVAAGLNMDVSTVGPTTTVAMESVFASLVTPLYIRAAADQTKNTDAAIANDATLLLTVEANCVYEMLAFIIYTTSTTADIRMGFAAPAGATLDWEADSLASASAATSSIIYRGHFALAGVNVPGGITGQTLVATMKGILITSATAGTFAFRWAQGTSEGTDTVRESGSALVLRRVA